MLIHYSGAASDRSVSLGLPDCNISLRRVGIDVQTQVADDLGGLRLGEGHNRQPLIHHRLLHEVLSTDGHTAKWSRAAAVSSFRDDEVQRVEVRRQLVLELVIDDAAKVGNLELRALNSVQWTNLFGKPQTNQTWKRMEGKTSGRRPACPS